MNSTIALTDAEKKITVDKFVAAAYNNPALMRFLQIAAQSFESGTTAQLILHVKNGVAKGGDLHTSF